MSKIHRQFDFADYCRYPKRYRFVYLQPLSTWSISEIVAVPSLVFPQNSNMKLLLNNFIYAFTATTADLLVFPQNSTMKIYIILNDLIYCNLSCPK